MRSLKMCGAGSCGGGIFKDVRLEGSHRIKGNIECEHFYASGVCTALGSISSLIFNVEGAMTLQSVKTKEMLVAGACKCQGVINCELLEAEGYFRANEEMNAEQIRIEGKFKLLGPINAEQITLLFHEPSSITEVGAGKIEVRKLTKKLKPWSLSKLFMRKKVELEAHLMEADDIYLEFCRVEKVCGDHVIIGPDCVIDEIEYRGSIEIHPTSKVKHQKQI